MDIEAVKALAIVYGNYRAAITAFDILDGEAARQAAVQVVAAAKALLACQAAFKCDVADTEQIDYALEEARSFYNA